MDRPGAREDQRPSSATGRRVRRIFLIVLALNLSVALAKAVFGLLAGSVSMVADALHSGFDSFSNVVGIVALYFAAKPPDPEHPYGPGKIETLGTLVIGAMLLLTPPDRLARRLSAARRAGCPRFTAVTAGHGRDGRRHLAVSPTNAGREKNTGARSWSPTPSTREATSSSLWLSSAASSPSGSGSRRPTRSSPLPSASSSRGWGSGFSTTPPGFSPTR